MVFVGRLVNVGLGGEVQGFKFPAGIRWTTLAVERLLYPRAGREVFSISGTQVIPGEA